MVASTGNGGEEVFVRVGGRRVAAGGVRVGVGGRKVGVGGTEVGVGGRKIPSGGIGVGVGTGAAQATNSRTTNIRPNT